MFDIGFTELMVVAALGLFILGPERLPKAARTVGLFVGQIRRTLSGIQQEIEQEVRNQEIREKLKDPLRTFTQDEENTIAPQSSSELESTVEPKPLGISSVDQQPLENKQNNSNV